MARESTAPFGDQTRRSDAPGTVIAAERQGATRGIRIAHAVAILSSAALGIVWAAPIMARMIEDADFPFHLAAASEFASTGRVTVPHFLLQVTLGGVLVAQSDAAVVRTGLLYFVALYGITASLMCWYIARGSRSYTSLVASVLLAIAVLMSAPILPRIELGMFLIGYFPPNVYHNPTILVAKPLLVLSIAAAAAALTRTMTARVAELVQLASPFVLLGVAKPNYLACIVPPVFITALWRAARKRPVSWSRVAVLSAAAVGTLAAMFLLYSSDALALEGEVLFAPLRVISIYAPVDPESIVISLLATLAFPLAVLLSWPRAVWRQLDVRLAWAAAVIGLLISYCLAEAGSRLPDGNFLWTGQMAVFVLFVVSARATRELLFQPQHGAVRVARLLLVVAVLGAHVESGIRHVLVKVTERAWQTWWL